MVFELDESSMTERLERLDQLTEGQLATHRTAVALNANRSTSADAVICESEERKWGLAFHVARQAILAGGPFAEHRRAAAF
jgi:hypothetical protein